MRKLPVLVSILTLIFGFTFYGEIVSINIHDTFYIISAEALCFLIWLCFTIIFWFIKLKKVLSKNEA